MIHIIVIHFGEPSHPVDGSSVFPEVASPIRIETFFIQETGDHWVLFCLAVNVPLK